VLNGTKAWATNAGTADLMMIMVRTDTPTRAAAQGDFDVHRPTDTKGYRAAKPEDKMGLRASNTAAIELNDVRLPADQMLGEEGMGFVYAMEGLDAGRLGIGAQEWGLHGERWSIASSSLPSGSSSTSRSKSSRPCSSSSPIWPRARRRRGRWRTGPRRAKMR